MEFNENGMIEPGLHSCTVTEFKQTFVDKFPSSQRRQEIFDCFINFVGKLSNSYNIHEIWVDGSFVTEKVNPNDVDIIIFLELEDFIKISPYWSNLRNINNIDAYCALAVQEKYRSRLSPVDFNTAINQRNYWRGQFGFDRADRPKGIMVLSSVEIDKYLKGGDSDVNGCH